MSTPAMSTPPVLRDAMSPVARLARAYFAPVTRVTSTPAVFDPAQSGLFDPDAPPAPWISLGNIDKFKRVPGTAIQPITAGVKGATAAQFRHQLGARVEFDFRDWGKLQMALAGGSQHMNVLAEAANATPQPCGGTPVAAVPILPGSTATQIVFGAGSVNLFNAGDIIAVDNDLSPVQSGWIGSGVSAAYINNPADVQRDVNYIRRVTFNVGRVIQQTSTAVVLAQPLIGGAPPVTANAQKVVAFLDREGGSFFQEWSALFIMPEQSGGRVCFYYPRLQPAAAASEAGLSISPPLEAWSLHAAFTALPTTDPCDNEQVLCYRSYFPAAAAALY